MKRRRRKKKEGKPTSQAGPGTVRTRVIGLKLRETLLVAAGKVSRLGKCKKTKQIK